MQRIETLWRRVAFLGVDDTFRKPYVQRQQVVLIHCQEWVEVIIAKGEAECVEVAGFAADKIEAMLASLLAHFRDELKMDLRFPSKQQCVLIDQMKYELPVLQKKISNSKIAVAFNETILNCFTHFIKSAVFPNTCMVRY